MDRDLAFKKTILFLDEIQQAPEVLACLRYFYEKMPELPVICAGSLLDLAITELNFSMPVGRIEYLYIGPLRFQDFLRALGKTQLIRFLQEYQFNDEIPIAIHNKLLTLLRSYCIVGGLPEVIAAFVGNNFVEIERIKKSLLNFYREDFAKYASRAQRNKMQIIFNTVPRILGEKFKYSNISRDDKSTVIKESLDKLVLANIIHTVHHTEANGLPLGAELNEKHFKTYFLDIGLVSAELKLHFHDIENIEELILINSGKIAEQFVAQHLWYYRQPYESPNLFIGMERKSLQQQKWISYWYFQVILCLLK